MASSLASSAPATARRVLGTGLLAALLTGPLAAAHPALPSASPAASQDAPQAPDGHRGFGPATGLQDVLKVLRGRASADLEFVTRLDAMVAELEARTLELREHYQARNAYDLLDSPEGERVLAELGLEPVEEPEPAAKPKRGDEAEAPPPPELELLHAVFAEAAGHPLAFLARDDSAARAFAELYLDTRFRARVSVLAEYRTELSEFKDGLAMLRGAGDGWVDLSQTELQNVIMRVDLSASFLRAIQKDLNVLRPKLGEVTDPAAATALMAAAHARDEELRRVTFNAIAELEQERLARMLSTLFTGRFADASQTRVQVDWRGRMRTQGEPLRLEALTYMPGTPESANADPKILAMRRHDRLRWALRRANEALAYNPLDEELNYIAAHCSDFTAGDLASRALYDRFLVLRGIRAHDDNTIRGRELTDRELEALTVVQRPLLPGQRPERRRGGESND